MEIWKPIYLLVLPLGMCGAGAYLIDAAEKALKADPRTPEYVGKSIAGSMLSLFGVLGLVANAIVWFG